MSLPQTGATHYHVKLGQKSFNQRFGCLLCSMARIYNQWDGSLDKRKVSDLVVHCCCQDGYRAQVPQHPIYSSRYIFISARLPHSKVIVYQFCKKDILKMLQNIKRYYDVSHIQGSICANNILTYWFFLEIYKYFSKGLFTRMYKIRGFKTK